MVLDVVYNCNCKNFSMIFRLYSLFRDTLSAKNWRVIELGDWCKRVEDESLSWLLFFSINFFKHYFVYPSIF